MSDHAQDADYVIVGAGTSGSVLAALLAESGRYRVAILEAGPRDSNPWIHIPIGFFKTLQNPKINWAYDAAFSAEDGARQMIWPRGRVVGGSGSINGLVYVQGAPADYGDWADLVGPEWGWSAVSPRFDTLRQREMVSKPRWRHPLVDAFLSAAEAAGFPRNEGFNGGSQLGAGYYELNTRNGFRASTARRFLRPALRNGRIDLITEAWVTRVDIQNGRATGVRYRKGGTDRTITARREVILCAGAIATPQILQVSGLGPADVLREAGVEVLRDMPGVGRNLRDHFAVRTVHKVKGIGTLNEASRSLLSKAKMAAQYAWARTGPLSIGAGVAGVFASVDDPTGRPDVQFIMGPLSTDNPARGLHDFAGMTLTYCQSYPESAGYVHIRSPDIRQKPTIVANYLTAQKDQVVVAKSLTLARRILAQPALSRYIDTEHLPGADVTDDAEVLAYARQFGGTVYHPSCTVAMGDDSQPLTPDLRVRGIDGLRVADASAMPRITSGNINAVCAMIGVAASQLILAEA